MITINKYEQMSQDGINSIYRLTMSRDKVDAFFDDQRNIVSWKWLIRKNINCVLRTIEDNNTTQLLNGMLIDLYFWHKSGYIMPYEK